MVVRNNLENIKEMDAVYKFDEERISYYFNNEAKAVFKSLKEMRIAAADIFFSFYTVMPTLAEKNDNAISESIRKMMERYMGTEEFKKIRETTELNDTQSIEYTKNIMSELLNRITESLKDRQRKGMQPYLRDTDEDTKKILGDAAAGNKEAMSELESLLRGMQVEKEIEKFGENSDFLKKSAAGIGTSLKFSEKYNALNKAEINNIESMSNKLLNKIVDSTQKKKSEDKHGEMVRGYYTTRDISKAIRKEFAMPEDIFLARMASGELLALEREESKKGAFYVLLDKSFSMKSNVDLWAKSVAYALYKKAQIENRRYYIRPFDFSPHKRFSKKTEIENVLLRSITDGGTDINKAISVAISDIKHDHKLRKEVNTIIIITDGEDKIYAKQLSNMLKSINCGLISILVKKEDNEGLKGISDVYLKVEEYSAEKAYLILKEIIRHDDKFRTRKKSTSST